MLFRSMRRIGFDVADAGEDRSALIDFHGPVALWSDLWKAKEDELLKSCTRAWAAARERNAMLVYDAIGVGASVGAQVNVLNKPPFDIVRHMKFFAGGSVIKPDSKYKDTNISNRDMFSNVKAQAWWLCADKLRNTFNAVRNGHQHKDEDMLFLSSDRKSTRLNSSH